MNAARAVSLLLLVFTGLPGKSRPQAPPPRADGLEGDAYRFSVNVDHVVLQATVHDQKGRPALDLRQQDFEVHEDGVRQSIRLFGYEDVPVTVGLVVDHSGSMRQKLPDVMAAARTFVRSSNQQDQMFVVNFNEHVTLGLPAAVQFTNRLAELETAISSMPANGKTALYDAIVKARIQLRAGSRDKKVLIVISDGGDNASSSTLAEVLKMGERSNAILYTIGIYDEDDTDRNLEALRRLARATGGAAFFPGQRSDVVAVCERIARDIRQQYTIGYVSSNTGPPGVYRAIRVAAKAGKAKLVVRTRAGYIPGGEPEPVNRPAAK